MIQHCRTSAGRAGVHFDTGKKQAGLDVAQCVMNENDVKRLSNLT